MRSKQGKGREDRGAANRTGPGDSPSAAILDAAFRRAYRATPHGASKLDRSRRRAQLKIVRSSAVVLRHLDNEARPLRRPPPTEFERELVGKAYGPGTLERALGRLRRARERIRGLAGEEERGLRSLETEAEFAASVRRFYGRLASHVREVDPDIRTVRKIAGFLKERPSLTPGVATIVVAGLPNVGKSSLVARLSSAKPKVAAYPFTTQAIQVGHADLGFDRIQVLDTPGVLGRAHHANPAETEAETAVGGAATAVLFVLDASGTSGYTLEDQEHLLERWKLEYPNLAFLEVETKADLAVEPTHGRLRVSAKTGEGLPELLERLQDLLGGPRIPRPPESREEEWPVWPVASEGSGEPSPK